MSEWEDEKKMAVIVVSVIIGFFGIIVFAIASIASKERVPPRVCVEVVERWEEGILNDNTLGLINKAECVKWAD